MKVNEPTHVVAVFGGACSGSVAAEVLSDHGAMVVVFEQNARPYGKIEDGLPRWHRDQRRMEYRKIDERLTRPRVHYVPQTKLGEDLDFLDVVTWGWSAVLLANGAWKDRPLDQEVAPDLLGRGLVYQNPFVYWFNHKNEASYDGPRYEVPEGAVCIGGGLASIDVIKILQLETYGRALAARGVGVDVYEMEHEGIPKYCQKHGVEDPAALGVRDAVLVYRRRVEDMPLASPPKNASEKQLKKIETVRQKILSKCQDKFLFEMRPLTVCNELVVEDDRVAGVVLQRTELNDKGRPEPVPGSEETLRTELVVSSIGSVPEPIPGIEMTGTYYRYADWDTGAYGPIPGVFGVGNVVTGKGNIKASLDHSKFVSNYLIESYLGVGADEERDISAGFAVAEDKAQAQAAAVEEHLARVKPLAPAQVERLLARVEARQREVGYEGDYAAWIQKVTPPDME